MSREARCSFLVLSSIAKDDDKLKSQLIIVFGCFALVVEDDNEAFNLWTFSTCFLQV